MVLHSQSLHTLYQKSTKSNPIPPNKVLAKSNLIAFAGEKEFIDNSLFGFYALSTYVSYLKSQKRPTIRVFVYKIQVNSIHTILKYGDYHDFMDR